MAWFSGKVSLGNFPDLAGAVNKLSESVKNIEKNFDSALGLEEKSDATGSSSEGTDLFVYLWVYWIGLVALTVNLCFHAIQWWNTSILGVLWN